jgi:subtilisin family serine protease
MSFLFPLNARAHRRRSFHLLKIRLFKNSLLAALLIVMLLASASLPLTMRSVAAQTSDTSENASFASPQTAKRARAEFVPGEILVRFRAAENSDSTAATAKVDATPHSIVLRAEAGREFALRVERFDGSNIVEGLRLARLTESSAPDETLRAIAALNALPDVLYAEPNYIRHILATPNDPRYGDEWGLKNTGQQINGGAGGTSGADIKAEQAWDITKGDRSIVVGVIDEGIDVSHPDLKDNIWTNPAPGSVSGITGDVNGYDFVNNTGNFTGNPHATHVAGTIGASGNNGIGVVGINWQVSLMSLKVFGVNNEPTSGADSVILRAYAYAKAMKDLYVSSGGAKGANIRALNNSYGGGGFSQSSLDAIKALGDSGILFVAAAGNDARDNGVTANYPSDYDAANIISVAATTRFETLASFSNFGLTKVHLGAPGSGIISTTPNNTYSFFSGTSMATPHVTGAAALICAAYPNISLQKLRAVLIYNGDVVDSSKGLTITNRRLNVYNSLVSAGENDTTPPAPAGNLQITAQQGRSLSLSWTAPGDDGMSGRASNYELLLIDPTNGQIAREPLPLVPDVPGATQTVSLTLPFRFFGGTLALRTFDNVGNSSVATVNVNIGQTSATDPYKYNLTANAPLSTGGTALNLHGDDKYLQNYSLPFAFPFYGQNRSTVTVSTNGALYFSTPPFRSNGDADDAARPPDLLNGQTMIAGLLDDLTTELSARSDADVYVVTPNAGSIIFRWQAQTFSNPDNPRTPAPVNFEIELRQDGTILVRYGSGNTQMIPVVGIGGGAPNAYIVSELTKFPQQTNLTNASTVTFAPRSSSFATPTLQFSASAYSVNEGDGKATITVTRAGDASSPVAVNYATANGTARDTADYNAAIGTLRFAAGETSKTINIFVNDDGYVNGARAFSINLSNPSGGAVLGSPASATITINDNDSAPATTNPIDNPTFFVRQHYVDFLNRDPDAGGLQFWTNQIVSCNGDAACIDNKRQNVSAAYFLSTEFQQTGYLVYRAYKAAFGRLLRLNEFTPDTQEIGRGVIVGQGDWQTQLETNKQNFFSSLVNRPAFVLQYPSSLSYRQFVDALNVNAGGVLSQTDRDALVAGLQNGAETRATVLRKVAENQTFANREFNAAFVLMQYFGYLRRNPDDPPDNNLAGYNFWLNKLNSFNGDYIKAEMVRSFIVSQEYRKRFGNQ